MRLLYATILVTGCVTGEVSEPPIGVDDGANGPVLNGGDGAAPARLVPEVCATRAWRIRPDAEKVDLAVVPTATGATILTTPTSGGAIRGFRIDGRGEQVTKLITVRDDDAFVGVSAGIADGRLVVAGETADGVTLDVVRDDLGAVFALGKLDGTVVGELPIVGVRGQRVAVAAGDGGVTTRSFEGAQWEPTASTQLSPEGVVSMTSAGFLDDAMVAWSTASGECHLLRVAAGVESIRKFACDQARLAAVPSQHGGTLVYEDGGDVYRTQLRLGGESELANRIRIAEHASAPRVVFDGERTWISFIDSRRDVVIGFLDAHGELVSRALEGVRPTHDGYELAVLDGGVWVVTALGKIGVGAQRLCAVAR